MSAYEFGDDPYSSSFPTDSHYVEEVPAHRAGAASSPENKPRILLMGLRKSGKSSIQKVVFHKMSPNETLFLESTAKLVKNGM
mmetsp:Transcript_8570/g.21642  ORF Transcript_8570/g.21642 Transcript_8570/m.21642 type:complete len:83 (-) Transcript_8570:1061-1309(-)